MALRPVIRRISSYLLVLLAFTLPIHDQTVAIIIIALSFCWLATILVTPWPDVWKGWTDNRTLFAFAGLYFLYIIGLAFTENMNDGILSLQVKLPLLFFPVFIATPGLTQLDEKQWGTMKWAFISGCLLMSLYYFFQALHRYIGSHEMDEFYYLRLLCDRHPSYVAMYTSISIGMIAYHLMEKKILKKYLQFLAYVAIAWFHVFIFLLSSKAGIVGLLLVIVISSAYLFVVKRKTAASLALLAGWTGMFLLSVLLFRPALDRFSEAKAALEKGREVNAGTRSSTASRLLIWQSSWEVIRHHPVTGTGTGDVRDELVKQYDSRQFMYGIKRRLNAHNQYLETWMATGLAGMILLTGYLVGPWIRGLKKKDYLLLLFLSVVGIHFLFESMLERQAGVVFYAFFNALLYKKAVRHVGSI